MAKAKKLKGGAKARKKWVEILAPNVFREMPVCETFVYDAREGIGKTVSVNMMALTKNPKRQGINLKFLVTGQREDKLTTDFIGLRMMPPVVKRVVRRGKDKIVDSFICTTSDMRKIRVKPLIITRSKVKGSVITAIRKAAKMHIARTASNLAYEKLVEEIVSFKLQRGMYELLNKIYPVSICEIRSFEIMLKESAPSPKKAEEKKAEKEEVKDEAKAEA